MKIAIAGKGGVGKTFIASSIAWSLARAGYRALAIDADEAPNLALSLGLTQAEAAEITPVLENGELIRSKTGTGYTGVYNLNFTVDDVVRDFSVPTPAGVHLLVMGTVKAAGSGCACPANTLLQALLRHLVVERDEAVVLDLEAGVEHLGRRTAEGVDRMLVVSDANRKSLLTAATIAKLSRETGIPWVRLVGNRIDGRAQEEIVRTFAEQTGVSLLGTVPFDSAVAQAGILGSPTPALGETPAFRAIEGLTGRLVGETLQVADREPRAGGRP